MSTVDRILNLLDARGISKNKMLSELHLAKNSFLNWTQRGTSPQGEALAKIADYLGCSVDYLLGRAAPSGAELPADEGQLLSDYRALNAEGQEKLLDYADDLLRSGKYDKKNAAPLLGAAENG